MNYEEIIEKLRKEREESELKSKADLFNLVQKLRSMNIETVNIHFDGAGDSGEIDEIEILPISLDNNNSIRDEIEEWADLFLEGTGVDWYNNEGGFGDITINIDEGKFNYEVNQRHIEYTCEASGEEDI